MFLAVSERASQAIRNQPMEYNQQQPATERTVRSDFVHVSHVVLKALKEGISGSSGQMSDDEHGRCKCQWVRLLV